MAEPTRTLDGIREVEAATHVFASAAAMHYCRLLDSRNQRRLVRAADVFVTNCLPAMLEELRIAWADPEPLNPRIRARRRNLRSLQPED